jgi:hypothetical protein
MNKQRIIFSCACAILFSAILFSCKKDVGKIPVEPVIPAINQCDTITYLKHIRPLFVENCISCHGDNPANGIPLNSYELFKAKAETGKIKARVIDGTGGYMPQDKGKLPQAKIDLISCWLNNGYKP